MQGSGKGGKNDVTTLTDPNNVALTPQATGYQASLQDPNQYQIKYTVGAGEPDYLGYLPGEAGGPASPEYTQTAYTGMATAGTKGGDDLKKRLADAAKAWATSSSGLTTGGGSIPGLGVPDVRMGDLTLRPNPAFPLTPGQSKILRRLGIPDRQAQTFIANQILSGNPAYGPYTGQQVAAARSLASGSAASSEA